MSQRKHRVTALTIREGETEENIRSTKHILFKRQRVIQKETTTNAYVDSDVFDCRLYKNVLIHVVEVGGTNGVTFKVLGCIDPTHWETLDEADTTEFAVVASGSKVLDFTVPWSYVKLQAKSTVADSHGKIDAYISGRTP